MGPSNYPTPPPSAARYSDEKHYDPIAERAMSYYESQIDDGHQSKAYPAPQSSSQTPFQQPSYQDRVESLRYPAAYNDTPQRPMSASKNRPNSYVTPRSPRPTSPSYAYRVPKPYTPYSASRPAPRKGLFKRTWTKLKSMLRSLVSFVRRHPIAFGLASIVPVIASIGLYKAVTLIGSFWALRRESRRSRVDGLSAPKTKSRWAISNFLLGPGEFRGWWFDEFKGFGGTKSGPLEGVLKMLHMLVNHWCKLSPSGVPRTLSILLEIYFLDAVRKSKKEAGDERDESQE